MKKYRIMKGYWPSGREYFYVQQKKLFWWGVPDDSPLYDIGCGPSTLHLKCKIFNTEQECLDALDLAKKCKSGDIVIKEIEI